VADRNKQKKQAKGRKNEMNGVLERPVKEIKTNSGCENIPLSKNPFFIGVFRQYHGGTVEKGVYNSMNLALYSYGYQNPVRMIDPDGNEVNPDNPDYWGSHGNEYHPAPEIKMPNNDLGNPSNGGTQLPGYAVQYQEGNRDKLIGATLSLGVDIASEFSKKINSIISNVITPALDLQSGASMLDVGKNRLLGMIPGYSIGKDLIDIGANSGRFVPYMGPTATPDTGSYDYPATATIGFTPVTPAFTVTPNRNNIRY
jgi:hypothetical protein